MQKWEYLQIVCDEGHPRYVNGQEIPNWQQGPTLWEAVRLLFQKGWELVDDPRAPTSDWWVVTQWLTSYSEDFPHHFRRHKN